MAQEQGKARSLIHKFVQFTLDEEELEWEYAKQCAIICVNEILSEIYGNNLIATDKRRIYWQQVLTEIEKL